MTHGGRPDSMEDDGFWYEDEESVDYSECQHWLLEKELPNDDGEYEDEEPCPKCGCIESGCWEVGCMSEEWEDEDDSSM